ncbi:VanZ family protein [Candidatus Albibeggiatoa sp. nov. NOAA]|uniref:VanZ family protein n=1 Tax=Candidatus Albibeggiatoa sp. nov. NOAA TaxID=3162724 RepID=UPI0032F6E199|nr:VanZ family protein [Thiotrichaceae bacterium]
MNIRITVLYGLLILTIIMLANFGMLSPISSQLHKIPYSDKIIHFLLIGGLAFMVNYSLKCSAWQLGGWPILKGSVFVAIFITLEEFSQYFQVNRSFDLIDLAANYAGILAFTFLSLAINCFKKPKKATVDHAESFK